MNNVVLVLGGHGQVGKAFTSLNHPYKVVALTRHELDICSVASIRRAFALHAPDLVLNLAAYTDVDAAEADPLTAFQVNAYAVELIAKICVKLDIPLVHLSTDYVFSGVKAQSIDENVIPAPAGVYASSKLCGEIIIRSLTKKSIILRVSAIFSSHARCFPRAILTKALKCSNLEVVSDQVTAPTGAFSIASILQTVLTRYFNHASIPWGTYHFSQKPYCAWDSFARDILDRASRLDDRFCDVSVVSVSSNQYGSVAKRPSRSCLDSSRLEVLLDLDATVLSWESDLSDTVKKVITIV